VFLINLRPRLASIETFVEQVHARVSEIEKKTGRKDVIIIGHSMGGIVASLYAQQHPESVAITIGSPLQGTHMARFALGQCGAQMRLGATLLQKIQKPYYSIGTKTDQIVFPYTSTMSDTLLSGIGHIGLLYSPRVASLIESMLHRLQ
jgi:alpha-beta hydrolase superfamily lysophospholipase